MNITKYLEGYGWVFESSIKGLGPLFLTGMAQASYIPGHENAAAISSIGQ